MCISTAQALTKQVSRRTLKRVGFQSSCLHFVSGPDWPCAPGSGNQRNMLHVLQFGPPPIKPHWPNRLLHRAVNTVPHPTYPVCDPRLGAWCPWPPSCSAPSSWGPAKRSGNQLLVYNHVIRSMSCACWEATPPAKGLTRTRGVGARIELWQGLRGDFGHFCWRFWSKKVVLWDVHAHVDCAGSHKMWVAVLGSILSMAFGPRIFVFDHVHFDSAGSHKVCARTTRLGMFAENARAKRLLWDVHVTVCQKFFPWFSQLINRNSLRAASYCALKPMTDLNSLKPCVLSFILEAIGKTCSKC